MSKRNTFDKIRVYLAKYKNILSHSPNPINQIKHLFLIRKQGYKKSSVATRPPSQAELARRCGRAFFLDSCVEAKGEDISPLRGGVFD